MAQFEEAYQMLLTRFPRTLEAHPKLHRYRDQFVAELLDKRGAWLAVSLGDYYRNEVKRWLLMHALGGFVVGNYKCYYDAQDLANWPAGTVAPAEDGIMDWAGALRRVFYPYWTERRLARHGFDDTSGDLLTVFPRASLGLVLFGSVTEMDHEDYAEEHNELD